MAEQLDSFQDLKEALEPFIKPREQVNYVRRILALHLGTYSHHPARKLLGLAGTFDDIHERPEVKGVREAYIDALERNVAAHRQFEDATHMKIACPRSGSWPTTPPESELDNIDIISRQVHMLRLSRKRQKLSMIQKCLDELLDQPAASRHYLEPEIGIDTTPPLSSTHNAVSKGLTTDQGAGPDLNAQADQLEKKVLRANSLHKQESWLLQEARSRNRNNPNHAMNTPKLDALRMTRNELIVWIEAELGTATTGELTLDFPRTNVNSNINTLAAALTGIAEKYSNYLRFRCEILGLLIQQPIPILPGARHPPPSHKSSQAGVMTSMNCILTAYVDQLLAQFRNQAACVSHSSYVSAALCCQSASIGKALRHLSEESQLLLTHPTRHAVRRRSRLLGEVVVSTCELLDLSEFIRSWIFAADSAKITSLEAVAEAIECSQLALENSNNTINSLRGLSGLVNGCGDAYKYEFKEGFWPEEIDVEEMSTHRGKTPQKMSDIWFCLHGRLGLIGHE